VCFIVDMLVNGLVQWHKLVVDCQVCRRLPVVVDDDNDVNDRSFVRRKSVT